MYTKDVNHTKHGENDKEKMLIKRKLGEMRKKKNFKAKSKRKPMR